MQQLDPWSPRPREPGTAPSRTAVRPRPGSYTSDTAPSPEAPRPRPQPCNSGTAPSPASSRPHPTENPRSPKRRKSGSAASVAAERPPPQGAPAPAPGPRTQSWDTTSPHPRPHPARPASHQWLTNAYSRERACVGEDAERPREARRGPKKGRGPPS